MISSDALLGTLIGAGVSILTTWMMIRAEQKRARCERYLNSSFEIIASLYSKLMELCRIVREGHGIFDLDEDSAYMSEGYAAAHEFRLEFERKRLFIPGDLEARMEQIVTELENAYSHIGYRHSSNYREFHNDKEQKKFDKQAKEAEKSVRDGKLARDIKSLTDDLRNYMQEGKKRRFQFAWLKRISPR